jgi:hypothetical protein
MRSTSRCLIGAWELRCYVHRVSTEGNLSGTVEVCSENARVVTLASSGVFKTDAALFEHLKRKGRAWLEVNAEQRQDASISGPLPRKNSRKPPVSESESWRRPRFRFGYGRRA